MKTWWFFWRMFLFKKWTFMLQTGSAIVSMVAIEHAVGLAQREVFDTLTGDAATSLGVWAICAALVGLGLGHSIAFVGDEMLFRFNRFTMATLLQGNAFDYVLRLRGGGSLPASPGEAVSRFRGDVRQAVMPMMDFDMLIANFLFFVVAMAIMARISAVTAFAVFLPLFAVVVIVHAARGRIRQYRQDAREAAGGVTGVIGEIFGMVETVKVSNAEGRVIDEFERVNSERGRTSLKDEVLGQTMEAFASNAHHVATGVLLALLARSMVQGDLTVGDLSLFVFYLANTQSFSREIGKLLTGYRRAGVSTGRLLELMPGAPPETLVEPNDAYLSGSLPEAAVPVRSAEDRLEVLEVEGLTHVSPGTGAGVHGVSFRLERGDFVVVAGRVGSGKTTLLRTLVGWLPSQSGSVRWNGTDVGREGGFLTPPRCAYLPQVPRLFSESLRANILMGLPEDRVDLPGAVRLAVLERDVGRAGRRPRHAGRPSGSETFRGAAAALGRGENVRARAGSPRTGRRLQRPGRRNRARLLGPAVRAQRHDDFGRLQPADGPRTGRPRGPAEGRTSRVAGNAELSARDVGRDAPPMGRRDRLRRRRWVR